jgi:hypothetical protein
MPTFMRCHLLEVGSRANKNNVTFSCGRSRNGCGRRDLSRPLLGLSRHQRRVANLFPSLGKTSLVRSSDTTNLVRFILEGVGSVATPAEPTAPGTPAFRCQLDDEQVAAVVTYIRNNRGSPAASVSADGVRKQHDALA